MSWSSCHDTCHWNLAYFAWCRISSYCTGNFNIIIDLRPLTNFPMKQIFLWMHTTGRKLNAPFCQDEKQLYDLNDSCAYSTGFWKTKSFIDQEFQCMFADARKNS